MHRLLGEIIMFASALLDYLRPVLTFFETYHEFIIPPLILAAFGLAGYLFKLFMDRYAHRLAEKTETRIDDIVFAALRTPILVLFLIGGAEMALRYIALPPRIANWTHSSLFFLMGIVGILTSTRILEGMIEYFGERYPGLAGLVPTLRSLTKIAVWFIGIIIVLAWLGISISPLLVSFGVGGLAVGLALRGTLENFFSGLQIMVERSVEHGNYIELESGEKGYVVDIGWRTSKIRMLPNNLVIIPNSKLANSIVVNYDSPEQKMWVPVEVGVSYDSDLRKVEKVTIEVAKKVLGKVPGGVKDFDPFIRYHTFDDFSINFTVILQVEKYVDKHPITNEFIKELHERYEEEGIEIPFPITTVNWRSEGTQRT